MPSPKVLQDADIYNASAARVAVGAVREAVLANSEGRLIAPPRHTVPFDKGALVFTVGGTTDLVGFRAYDTFPNSAQDQVVAVWDSRTGTLEGIAIGEMVGALRTGALGALAVDLLARGETAKCAVLGSGLQARTQLLCVSTVRAFDEVAVFSPTAANRERFATELNELTGLPVVPAGDAAEAVEGADVVLCATASHTPVFDVRWLSDGVHVNTLGPKYRNAHELPVEAAEQADVIATDSPQQIAAQGTDHFLAEHASKTSVVDLAEVLTGSGGRVSASQRTLFLSAGLAGTETLVAHALLASTPTECALEQRPGKELRS
jgi:ornithine cyclodeaminase/alanine dehydrogenase-like protein (mu-crystallin family)